VSVAGNPIQAPTAANVNQGVSGFFGVQMPVNQFVGASDVLVKQLEVRCFWC